MEIINKKDKFEREEFANTPSPIFCSLQNLRKTTVNKSIIGPTV